MLPTLNLDGFQPCFEENVLSGPEQNCKRTARTSIYEIRFAAC